MRYLIHCTAALALLLMMSAAQISAADADLKGSIKGTVTDKDDKPVANAQILLFKAVVDPKRELNLEDKPNPEPVARTTTDKDGRFVLSNIAPGDYFVRAWADGVGTGTADAKVAEAEVTIQIKLDAAKLPK